MSAALMDKLTGGQTGGTKGQGVPVDELSLQNNGGGGDGGDGEQSTMGGRRHRKSHKGNSWLAHVKATMKLNRGKSFKQVLKIAKKSYKKSQSQSSSQSGGKMRKSKGGNGKSQKKYQNGGSGGKVAGVGASASPYV
jgi:hypothetical protein